MKNYAARNMAIFKKGIRAYARDISDELIDRLEEVARRMVEMIDGNFDPIDTRNRPSGNAQFPVWTANMHDATGVGVYSDGELAKYVPTKQARWKQSNGSPRRSGIDGAKELEDALNEGLMDFGSGIWIVLFSAVPYAYHINEEGSKIGRGQGFFDETSEGMLNEVLNGLAPLKAVEI